MVFAARNRTLLLAGGERPICSIENYPIQLQKKSNYVGS